VRSLGDGTYWKGAKSLEFALEGFLEP
jgi:hypothetical protein